MGHDAGLEDVVRRYAAARAAHYSAGNLRRAIALYEAIVADHPESREAGYSLSQIENIVRAVIPRAVLLEAGLELALAQIRRAEAEQV